MISINDLAKMIIGISSKNLEVINIPGPVGVRGRNSNNDLIHDKLKWKPSEKLRTGLIKTYEWIELQTKSNG